MARRALVIAGGQYDDDHFAALPAATADAAALAEVLADPAIGDFAVDTLVDAGQRQVMRALESFFGGAASGDLLLLHLSLHGWKDLQNRLYFVVKDTERDYPGSTAIPAGFIGERMAQSRSRRMVLLLDCCYSGAFNAGMLRRASGTPHVDVGEPFAGTGRVVLTASTALQFAHEGERDVRSSRAEAQPAVFTGAVVQGLRDGSADLNGDGVISADELYDYVHERVRRVVPGQTPTLSVDSVQGTLVLAHSAHHADRDLLVEMRGAVADRQAWKRIGSLHLVERLLGSVREPTRDAAREALRGLVADTDREVARRARELWHQRGLGDLPAAAAAPRARERLRTGGRPVVGIDFGTTNSAIGLVEGGDVRVVPNAEGALTTPSLVAITEDGRTLVGAAAKRQAVTNAEYTVRSVKLRLGTGWSVERAGVRYTAEQIAALILARLHDDAVTYVGGAVHGAVLTVPAYFDHVQRHALSEAAATAGINVLRIINEPTAASMTYGLNRAEDETVLMFDLGGGTFDVSLLEIGDGICEVKATAGDNHLGGDDWDQRLVDHLVRLVKQRHGVDVSQDAVALQRLKEAAEAAKIDLSSAKATAVRLPYLTAFPAGPVHLDLTLTRAEFEAITRDALERCRSPIERVMKDSRIGMDRIDHVILVGGATRMPAVGDFVRELTGGKQPYRGLIPEGVVTGAALQAGILVGEFRDSLLLDVIPISLGIETTGGVFTRVVERNTTIPNLRHEIFTTNRQGQERITLHVAEGEQETMDANRSLAVLELPVPPAPRGVPQVEVTFDIDANGILGVAAKDLGTGRTESLTVGRDTAEQASRLRRSAAWRRRRVDVPAPPPDAPAPPPPDVSAGREPRG